MGLIKEEFMLRESWMPERIHLKVALAINIIMGALGVLYNNFISSSPQNFVISNMLVMEVLGYTGILLAVYYLSNRTSSSLRDGLKFSVAYGAMLFILDVISGVVMAALNPEIAVLGLSSLISIPGAFISSLAVYGCFHFYSGSNLRKAAAVSLVGSILAICINASRTILSGTGNLELHMVFSMTDKVVPGLILSMLVAIAGLSRMYEISNLKKENFVAMLLIGVGVLEWGLKVVVNYLVSVFNPEIGRVLLEMALWDMYNLTVICSGVVIFVFGLVRDKEFWDIFY